MSPEKAFGMVLKEIRSEKELSQEQLAFDSDLDRTFISMLERGLRQPSLTSIIDIATALEIPAQQIIKLTVAKIEGQ